MDKNEPVLELMSNQMVNIIKNVAYENGYTVIGESNFQIYMDQWHSVGFEIKVNTSEYLQVHQLEDGDGDNGRYGRAVYSIRNATDLIHFCNIVIGSSRIRAKRT